MCTGVRYHTSFTFSICKKGKLLGTNRVWERPMDVEEESQHLPDASNILASPATSHANRYETSRQIAFSVIG
ncbi:hypothetical protein SNOG_09254 [Parastagonospora nodorum SN15]|uniref:Uncharacterized protein n=1 Tax=Phaeosphaeria nodorum (strain SN15 / ATCC MYA-4574 / FGSC 10173) TaxID=321614 RepID=Q0UG60_PHANO|nr:hypothetical protein SNOG_09254 [Parastagonospora nodorum SN15]EAT83446.1 hypothetical protein SNOG_09254 [Parastagonospora nodorum SN15]